MNTRNLNSCFHTNQGKNDIVQGTCTLLFRGRDFHRQYSLLGSKYLLLILLPASLPTRRLSLFVSAS